MPNRRDPSRGYMNSSYLLGRSMLQNPLRDFLRDLATRDRVAQFYDFKDRNEVNNFTMGNASSSTNFTHVAAIEGQFAGTVAATSQAQVWMIGKEPWAGNNNVTMEGRFKIDTVASLYILEFGFVNAAPTGGTTGVNVVVDVDVPTFGTGVTNAAMWVIDNSQTHTSMAFVSVGSLASQTVASTLITAATAGFTTPVADTYLTVKLQLLTDPDETGKTKVYGWINGQLRASHTAAAGAIGGTVSLFPYFGCKSVSNTAKIPTVDYISLAQDRTALMAALE